jgi:Domain of unknown function (DUF3520)
MPLAASIVDEGKSAYEASPDRQFAAAIAQFGMLLRNSPHKGTASWDHVLSLAKVATGADLDGTRKECSEGSPADARGSCNRRGSLADARDDSYLTLINSTSNTSIPCGLPRSLP